MPKVVRGCGTRQHGGVYLESELSENGLPFEWFMIDPPVAVNEKALESKRGQTVVRLGGASHLLDWVGSKYYENVADFIEEVRRFGASRRIRKDFDFSQLSGTSKLIFIHARGVIVNPEDYLDAMNRVGCTPKCVKAGLPDGDKGLVSLPEGTVIRAEPGHNVHEHSDACQSLYWSDLTDNGEGSGEGIARVMRTSGSTSYIGYLRPHGVTPIYVPGAFLMMPISRIVVVRDPTDPIGTENLRASIAGSTWIPVVFADE